MASSTAFATSSPASTNGNALSNSDKIGIGVGVPSFFIALIGVFLQGKKILKRKRAAVRKGSTKSSTVHEQSNSSLKPRAAPSENLPVAGSSTTPTENSVHPEARDITMSPPLVVIHSHVE